jgi:hypothetical protein
MVAILVLGFLIAAAALGGLFALFIVVPYWSAERRGRARWRDASAAIESTHPYRTSRIEAARAEPGRAPMLVRAAAMTSFLWAWGCLLWAIVVVLERQAVEGTTESLRVLPSLAIAFLVQRAARRILARRAGARPIAMVQAVHAVGLVAFGLLAESLGIDDVVADLAVGLGIGAAVQAALLYAAAIGNAGALARA